ncbi:MAG: ABC transporter permease [Bacteroidota bacterium]|jgi:lipoprotein-releasing system permease protein
MNLSLLIARRYFFSRKKSGGFNLITIISGISLLGYVVGAMALIIVLSVFNGFEVLFLSMYTHFDPDLQITPRQGKVFHLDDFPDKGIRQLPDVANLSATLEENVLLTYDDRQTLATVKGVDENYTRIVNIDSNIVSGSWELNENDVPYAAVGQSLAWQLAIDPNNPVKPLTVYVPSRSGTTSILDAADAFRKSAILPTAVFSVHQEVDEKYVLVPVSFLAHLLERDDERSSAEIKLKPGADMYAVQQKIQELCGPAFVVKNRFEQREAFFKIMRSEKLISYVILFFILLVAAANTIASLYLLMLEKRKDLQVLASMGFTRSDARNVFVFESLLLALTGGGAGILLGMLLTWVQQHYGLLTLNEQAAFIYQSYPVELRAGDVLIVLATVVALGFITALYPAKKAAAQMV